jgi:hypothetical protein
LWCLDGLRMSFADESIATTANLWRLDGVMMSFMWWGYARIANCGVLIVQECLSVRLWNWTLDSFETLDVYVLYFFTLPLVCVSSVFGVRTAVVCLNTHMDEMLWWSPTHNGCLWNCKIVAVLVVLVVPECFFCVAIALLVLQAVASCDILKP